MSLRNSRRGSLSTRRTATPSSGRWMRGAGGAGGSGVPDGAFSTWAGFDVEIGGTWADNSPAVQAEMWPVLAGSTAAQGGYGQWGKPLDIAVGAIFKSSGETWANAASGSYDSRWTTMLNVLKTNRATKGTTYIRFAHEFNGDWADWSVGASEVTNFKTAWNRFRTLQQSIFPASKLVWPLNDGTNTNMDVRTCYPGAGKVDVYGVDSYNTYPAVNTTSAVLTNFARVDSFGAPVGLEAHRTYAASLGLPMAICEWGTSGDPSYASGQDSPVFIQTFFDWLVAHGGTGAGQVLYDLFFNASGWPMYQFYPANQFNTQARAKYQAIWKTLGTATAPTTSDPVMGVSSSDEDHKFAQWDAVRTYKLSGAKTDAANLGVRVIALSDNTNVSTTGGSTSATAVRNFLEDFYYGAGSDTRQNIEVHYANGNEVDGDYQTGSLPTAYVTTVQLISQAIKTLNSDGSRRYPMASMWVDMTQNNIRTSGAGPRFKPIAQYLDGVACSMYPPGRQQDPVVFTPYTTYCDPVFDMIADWKATYPNITQFATWEFGIPIDHAVKGMGAGQGSASTNYTIRPRYVGGGIDSAGTNWTGFLQYIYNKCQTTGVQMREQCYWDQQVSADMPNQLFHDFSPLANPDTATAWHNWTPGSTLPHG